MIKFNVSSPLVEKLLLLERPPDSILINQVLQLPRQSLIADFETVITQLIQDFNDKTCVSMVAMHCVFFLTELKSENSLPLLLTLAKQDDEFIDCYFGDHTTETMWLDTLTMGKNNLDLIFEFIKNCNTNAYGVSFISDGLGQIALHYPDLRKRIIEGLDDMYRYNFTYREDYRITDYDWFILLITDLGAIELLDTIKPYFESGRMDGYDEWSDFEADVYADFDGMRPLMSLQERYTNFATANFEFYDELDEIGGYQALTPEEIIKIKLRTEAIFKSHNIPILENNYKIGRNESCPCGSGKKYKHCCLQN